jgi:hypothetical protein
MVDEIIVRCAWCGEKIGDITPVPGKQAVACKSCRNETIIIIAPNGQITVRRPIFR